MDSKAKYAFDVEAFQDVVPIKQYDGNPPILSLKYPPEYEQMMDVFRAIVLSGEVSERVYNLTYPVISSLPSNYNVWFVRRKCIFQLQKDLREEIKYLNSITPGNEKVYQIWEHRRQIIEKIGSPEGELEQLQNVFDADNKNYHGWGYRIWLCQHFNLFSQELSNIEYYIEEDIGNNSAWNYRYFLKSKILTEATLHEELKYKINFGEYVFTKIALKPSNEAAWNYLKGWFRCYEFKSMRSEQAEKSTTYSYEQFPEVSAFVSTYQHRFAQALLLDTLIQGSTQIHQAIQLCNDLKLSDPIRKKYWSWYEHNIKLDFEV